MMAQMRIDFQGRGTVETFPRARVQPVGDGIQLTLRVARQVRALGQVLAQQAMGVLVGAALPGACTERQRRSGSRAAGPTARARPSLSLDHTSGFSAAGRARAGVFCKARSGTRGICPVHLGQDDQAGGPLHQGADGRTIAVPLIKSPS